jgi:hypothetical protein
MQRLFKAAFLHAPERGAKAGAHGKRETGTATENSCYNPRIKSTFPTDLIVDGGIDSGSYATRHRSVDS